MNSWSFVFLINLREIPCDWRVWNEKVLIASVVGLISLSLGTVNAEAASFEEMKENVEANEGVVFNPEMDRMMTQEEAIEFIEIIETAQEDLNTSEVTEEMYEEAFEEVEPQGDVVADVQYDDPFSNIPLLPESRGSRVPTTPYELSYWMYPSNNFTGTGWRYSGYYFTFDDYKRNYLFGVAGLNDSFYFHVRYNDNKLQHARYVVPENKGYAYYPSTYNGRKLNGYFSTHNPAAGARYYIQ